MTGVRVARLFAMIFLVMTAAAPSQAQDRMRAGNWENTMTSADGRSMTHNACLSAQDAARTNGTPARIRAESEAALAKAGGLCKLTDFTVDDKHKTETMVCGADTIHNDSTFHGGESFETTMTRSVGGVTSVAHVKGRRTGDCKADAE